MLSVELPGMHVLPYLTDRFGVGQFSRYVHAAISKAAFTFLQSLQILDQNLKTRAFFV